jgi:hypothetical protein
MAVRSGDEQRQTINWNVRKSSLLPPYDTWPRWAIDLDIEIADIAGDVGAKEEEDTPEGQAKLAAYDQVREIIRRMVNSTDV